MYIVCTKLKHTNTYKCSINNIGDEDENSIVYSIWLSTN